MVAVNEKSVNHANEAEIRTALADDAAKYTSERNVLDTEYSTSSGPVLTGQRIHHHVHHHVQPVIQKETIQPEVVHTTIPVHETHQAAPIYHETTILPVKTMDEFLGGQSDLKASTPRQIAQFDGCPNLKDKSLEGKEDAIHGKNSLKANAAATGLKGGTSKVAPAVNGIDQGNAQAKMVTTGTN